MADVEPESEHPARKRLRLSGFDYRQPGMYFVTICTWDRRCHFGEGVETKVVQSALGRLVAEAWIDMEDRQTGVALDEFVVMPNHLHGLVSLDTASKTLSAVVGSFKSLSTAAAHKAGLLNDRKLWQRGFHDHVVRDEAALTRIREYIENNPLKWHLDRENPANVVRRMQRAGSSPAPTNMRGEGN
jgi:REP element-mobilizing transposase RayT